jgi:hypothetical protein
MAHNSFDLLAQVPVVLALGHVHALSLASYNMTNAQVVVVWCIVQL